MVPAAAPKDYDVCAYEVHAHEVHACEVQVYGQWSALSR